LQVELDETARRVGTSRGEYGRLLGDLELAQDQLTQARAAIGRLSQRIAELESVLGLDSIAGGGCDPSYPDVCIPEGAEDHDCAGGSGDPPFIEGPLTVLPPDPHGLDGDDNDGVGCEWG
jgi:hypothetical protein